MSCAGVTGEGHAEGFHEHSSQGSSQGPLRSTATGKRSVVVPPAAVPEAASRDTHRTAELQGCRQRCYGSGQAAI